MVDETVAQTERSAKLCDRQKTVLIIDDDQSQVLALAHRLQKMGFETLGAYSGRQAIDMALAERPDLVLLDLRLPDVDGFEVCSKLADAPETCGTPIIILSALERSDIIRRCRAVGSQYYLRKPYDPNVLLMLIENSLRPTADGDW